MLPSDCAVCALPALVLAEVRGLGRRRASARLTELGYSIGAGRVRRHLEEHISPAEQLLGLTALPVVTPPPAPVVPKGWEPGIRWSPGADAATLTLPASDAPHTQTEAEEELARMGYDPAEWVLEPKEMRHDPGAWHRDPWTDDEGRVVGYGDAYTKPIWRAIFALRRRTALDASRDEVDLADLRAWIGEMDGVELPELTAEGETLLVCLADWQTGKRDGGGLRGLMTRLTALPALVEARYLELTALGRKIEQIVFAGLGDLIDGCVGFFPAQTFQSEANGRQQERVARRALTALIRRVARLRVRIIVTGVGGNHGEPRQNGKSITSTGDNADMRVLESVAEVFEDAPGYEHVSFVIPEEELFIELDLSGRVTLFQHGHVGPKGWTGLWSWFRNMIAHRRTSATLLVVGHLHHEHYEQDGLLAIYQTSALEGESTWVRDAYGPATLPGTGTMLVSGRYGVRDLATLA